VLFRSPDGGLEAGELVLQVRGGGELLLAELLGVVGGLALAARGVLLGERAVLLLEALDLAALGGDLLVDINDAREALEERAVAEEEVEQRCEGERE
jgi:hypothetical protein